MNCDECKNLNEKREYAWNYFEYHAKQRMNTFNFFMVSAALISSGIMQCAVSKNDKLYWVIAISGISLMLISFIFWRLDFRNRNLISFAENALIKLENLWAECDKTDSSIRIFSCENHSTKQRNIHFKYSNCFLYLYCLFFLLGVIASFVSIVQIIALYI